MVRPERFELPTPCFVGKCSIQLSYGRTRCIGPLPIVDSSILHRSRSSVNVAGCVRCVPGCVGHLKAQTTPKGVKHAPLLTPGFGAFREGWLTLLECGSGGEDRTPDLGIMRPSLYH